jgi:hypothetical protein
MILLAEKPSLELILWAEINIAFYVKYKTGEELQYIVSYDITKPAMCRYSVQFLTETLVFETISKVLDFIVCYDGNSVELIEFELFY